jgi:autotransporter-associated beta strand protein
VAGSRLTNNFRAPFSGLAVHRAFFAALAFATLSFVGSVDVRAGTRTWVGGAANGNWSDDGNWTGGSGGGDLYTFDGTTRLTNTNNFTGADATNVSITFAATAGAFVLNGNTEFLTAGLTNLSSTNIQTLNLGLTFRAATGTIATTSNSIILNGALGGTNINKTGASTLFLNASNTFTGIFTNTAGAIRVANNNGLGTTAGGTVIAAGAALELTTNSAGGNLSISNEALTISGTGIGTNGALRNITGDNIYGGLITLGAASRINSDSGTLSITNTGTITGATFGLTIGGAGNVAVASIISNTSGSLTKDGAGTLFLTASNRFTGGTTINAGTIAISNNGAFASNNVTFGSNGTTVAALASLQVTNNYNLAANGTMNVGAFILTNTGIISNTGSLTKAGAGTLILGRANTYTGGTAINAGTVAISNGASFGSNTVTFASNGTTVAALASVQVTNNYSLAANGTMDVGAFILTNTGIISNTGSLTKAGAGTMILSGSNNFSGTTTVSAGVLSLSNTNALSRSTLDYSSAGTVSFMSLTGANLGGLQGSTNLALTNASGTAVALNVGGNNSSTTYSGALSGGGSLIKTGTGTLTLAAANTYSGGTTINAGTVAISNASAFGSNTVTFASNGTTVLALASLQVTNNYALTTNGTMDVGAFNLTNSGAISGAGSLNKVGTGTLALSGNSSFSGATIISNGAVRVSNVNGLGATNGGTTVIAGAALEVDGGITIGAEALTLSNNGISSGGALRSISGANTYGGLITLGTGVAVGVDADSLTLTGGVTSGVGSSFTKVGAGTLILNSTSTATGIVTISGGTMQLGTNGAIAPVAMNVTNGSTFDLNGRNATLGAPGNLNVYLTGATLKSGAGTISLNALGVTVSSAANANSSTISGNLNLGGVTNTFNVADGAAAEDLVVSAAVSNGGIIKTNTGVLVLSGANTYSGGTVVAQGTLSGNSTSLQGSISNSAAVIFDQVANGTYGGAITGTGSLTKQGNGTLTLTNANSQNGTTLSAGALQIGNGGTTGSLAGAITNNARLIFNRSDSLTQSGAITGTGSLTKNGAGTVTLSAANTFSGATTVSAGTLNLNNVAGGSLGSTTNVSVANGATLLISQANQVNNTAAVSMSGGTIRTASGVSEVFGDLTVTGSGFLDFGTTSYANANTINFGTYTPSALLTINNFNFGSTLTFGSDLTSTINNSSFFTFNSGGIASSSWNAGTSTFTITAIPETSTYVAAIGLLAMMLWPARKRIIRCTKRTLAAR